MRNDCNTVHSWRKCSLTKGGGSGSGSAAGGGSECAAGCVPEGRDLASGAEAGRGGGVPAGQCGALSPGLAAVGA